MFTDGFYNIDTKFTNAILSQKVLLPTGREVGLLWGGKWGQYKDFMHFELKPWAQSPLYLTYIHEVPMEEIKSYLRSFKDEKGNEYAY